MGLRFQKRIRVIPGLTLNLSLRGLSVSAGIRGARVTRGHGQTRVTVGVPGSGLSHTSITTDRQAAKAARAAGQSGPGFSWWRVFRMLMWLCVTLLVLAIMEALRA